MENQLDNPARPKEPQTYQLKIHLLGISPQIYRRLTVRADTTLGYLTHLGYIRQITGHTSIGVLKGFEQWTPSNG